VLGVEGAETAGGNGGGEDVRSGSKRVSRGVGGGDGSWSMAGSCGNAASGGGDCAGRVSALGKNVWGR
jgi:hypothetical protein